MLEAQGSTWFNPDTFSRELRERAGISRDEADSHAWSEGLGRLSTAIETRQNYAFETTLGGTTISTLLAKACETHDVIIWYCGLSSPELHIERVRNRIAAGGHSIPEDKIRARWTSSMLNLAALAKRVHEIHVYDNSRSAQQGEAVPDPKRVALIRGGQLVAPDPTDADDLARTPDWAKPIVAAALQE